MRSYIIATVSMAQQWGSKAVTERLISGKETVEISDLPSEDIFAFCSSEPAFAMDDRHDLDQLFVDAFEQALESGTESPENTRTLKQPFLPHTTSKLHPAEPIPYHYGRGSEGYHVSTFAKALVNSAFVRKREEREARE